MYFSVSFYLQYYRGEFGWWQPQIVHSVHALSFCSSQFKINIWKFQSSWAISNNILKNKQKGKAMLYNYIDG
jgi:hypothetical protein